MPAISEFRPACGDSEFVVLTVDEYEAIRLIDKENFSREEAAGYMQVSRPTVQQIYNTARNKLARALVDGSGIRIEGGDYIICDGKEKHCGCGGCRRHRNECRKHK